MKSAWVDGDGSVEAGDGRIGGEKTILKVGDASAQRRVRVKGQSENFE